MSVSVGADAEGLGEEGEGTWADTLGNDLGDASDSGDSPPTAKARRNRADGTHRREDGSFRMRAAIASRDGNAESEFAELDLDRLTPAAGGPERNGRNSRSKPLLAITGPASPPPGSELDETDFTVSESGQSPTAGVAGRPPQHPGSAAAPASRRNVVAYDDAMSGLGTPETVPSPSLAPPVASKIIQPSSAAVRRPAVRAKLVRRAAATKEDALG